MNFTSFNHRICFLGKTMSGKTKLCEYVIKKEKHLYDKIFAVSITESVNRFYSKFLPENCVYDNFSEKWLNSLIKSATNYKEKNPNKPKYILLILDDAGSEPDFISSVAFKQLMTRGRHIGISVIICQQYLMQCKPIIRNNMSFLCCGQMNNQSQQLLCDEFLAGNIDRKQFLEIYRNATKDYGFLIINNNSAKNSENLDEIYGVLRTPNL